MGWGACVQSRRLANIDYPPATWLQSPRMRQVGPVPAAAARPVAGRAGCRAARAGGGGAGGGGGRGERI